MQEKPNDGCENYLKSLNSYIHLQELFILISTATDTESITRTLGQVMGIGTLRTHAHTHALTQTYGQFSQSTGN